MFFHFTLLSEAWLHYQKNKTQPNLKPNSKTTLFPSISEKSPEIKHWIILSYDKDCGGRFCWKGEREGLILYIFLAGKGGFSGSGQEPFKYRNPWEKQKNTYAWIAVLYICITLYPYPSSNLLATSSSPHTNWGYTQPEGDLVLSFQLDCRFTSPGCRSTADSLRLEYGCRWDVGKKESMSERGRKLKPQKGEDPSDK